MVALEGVAKIQVGPLPLGKALVGGAVAGLADGVLDLIPWKMPEIAARGLAAYGVATWGPKYIGAGASEGAALFLTYDAAKELFDFRGMVRGFVGRFRIGGAGGASPGTVAPTPPKEGPRTIEDYLRARGG